MLYLKNLTYAMCQNITNDPISCVDRTCNQIYFREQCNKRSDCFYNAVQLGCVSKGLVILFFMGMFAEKKGLPHENHGEYSMFIYLFIHSFIFLFVCWFIDLCMNMYVCMYVCMYVYIYICLCLKQTIITNRLGYRNKNKTYSQVLRLWSVDTTLIVL